MTDKQIEDLANRLITAVEHLAPGGPSGWTIFATLVPLIAAGLVTVVGWKTLAHQRKVLEASNRNDDRSEWWKRAQWALEAAASMENDMLSAAGNEMLEVLVKSPMASDADKDLLDTAWKAGTGAVSQEAAVDAIEEAEEFAREGDLDDSSETSENEGTKEVGHG